MSGRVIKWILYIVPIVVFAFLLNTGSLLKRPMGRDDDVDGGLHAVEQAVLQADWPTAGSAWTQVHVAMDKVGRRIELAAERDELQDFREELVRLRGSIQANDRITALEHVAVLKELFEEFGH